MKTIFEITAYDSSSTSFIARKHYSSKRTALGSFKSLVSHLCEKYSISESDIRKYHFTDGGEHQTIILKDRINVTLVRWDVSKETTKWL